MSEEKSIEESSKSQAASGKPTQSSELVYAVVGMRIAKCVGVPTTVIKQVAVILSMPSIITEYPQFYTATNLEWKNLLQKRQLQSGTLRCKAGCIPTTAAAMEHYGRLSTKAAFLFFIGLEHYEEHE